MAVHFDRAVPILSVHKGAVGRDGDAELSVAANPGKSVEIEWDDAGSKGLWTTNVRLPWGKPDRAQVSFKRKFRL